LVAGGCVVIDFLLLRGGNEVQTCVPQGVEDKGYEPCAGCLPLSVIGVEPAEADEEKGEDEVVDDGFHGKKG